MSREILFTGAAPGPGSGGGLCAPCVMLAKFAVMQVPQIEKMIQAAAREDGPPLVIDVGQVIEDNGLPRIHDAVTTALYLPVQAWIPVCWTHVTALNPQQSAIQPASGFMPDGRPLPLLGR